MTDIEDKISIANEDVSMQHDHNPMVARRREHLEDQGHADQHESMVARRLEHILDSELAGHKSNQGKGPRKAARENSPSLTGGRIWPKWMSTMTMT